MDVIFVNAASAAEAFPGRWWVPSGGQLDGIEVGSTCIKVLAVGGASDLWDAHAVWLTVDERDAEGLACTIIDSDLDLDGYREGEQLSVPADRVFDIVAIAQDGTPQLNEDRARFMLGSRVLVGLTVLSHTGAVVEQRQFAGAVSSFEPDRGVELTLDDRSSYWLPPDPRALREARPGEYTLRQTGQTIVDPDYFCTWTVTQPADAQDTLPADGFDPA